MNWMFPLSYVVLYLIIVARQSVSRLDLLEHHRIFQLAKVTWKVIYEVKSSKLAKGCRMLSVLQPSCLLHYFNLAQEITY